MTDHSPILAPVVALVAWSLVMWLWMYARRIPAMNAAKIDTMNMVGGSAADLRAAIPPQAQWPADNYNHLMEQPTLFYAIALTLALLGAGRRHQLHDRLGLCGIAHPPQHRPGDREPGDRPLRDLHAGDVMPDRADAPRGDGRVLEQQRRLRRRRNSPSSPLLAGMTKSIISLSAGAGSAFLERWRAGPSCVSWTGRREDCGQQCCNRQRADCVQRPFRHFSILFGHHGRAMLRWPAKGIG